MYLCCRKLYYLWMNSREIPLERQKQMWVTSNTAYGFKVDGNILAEFATGKYITMKTDLQNTFWHFGNTQ